MAKFCQLSNTKNKKVWNFNLFHRFKSNSPHYATNLLTLFILNLIYYITQPKEISMICKFCNNIMFDNESDFQMDWKICKCGAQYTAFYYIIRTSNRKNAKITGRVLKSETWTPPHKTCTFKEQNH